LSLKLCVNFLSFFAAGTGGGFVAFSYQLQRHFLKGRRGIEFFRRDADFFRDSVMNEGSRLPREMGESEGG
jgi:hypothetical protein